ncbi:MAG: YaiI/YqxD family protein [Wenzhouxiangellaceae bacterium]|nr:YaiI/YqxD family protein [Wenzhouxiangellaceae bacterium]
MAEAADAADAARIWVDADACPGAIKEILFRAAHRTGIELTTFANHAIQVPPNSNIRHVIVSSGFDEADDEIVRRCRPGDLVVTADIPLAAEIIEKGGAVVTPRGERYTAETIRQRLNVRDFMETMRASGLQTGGPPPLSNRDRKAFADQLDRWLAKRESA